MDIEYELVMGVADVFDISGRGTVVTGNVMKSFAVGEKVYLLKPDDTLLETTIISIEHFNQILEMAKVGDNVGIWLSNVTKDDIPENTIIIRQR